MSSKDTNLNLLLQGAVDDGVITPASMMAFQVPDMGQQIQAGLGIAVDDVEASEVILLALVIDDTGSIRQAYDKKTGCYVDHSDVMIEGHKLVLDSVQGSKQVDDVMVLTTFIVDGVKEGFTPLRSAMRLNTSTYQADGGSTPLRDSTLKTLGTIVAKTQEFEDKGVACRSVTLIVTDGDDNSSRKRPDQVADVVSGMLAAEKHVILFMGIDDGRTDFKAVAQSMGLPSNCVLTPNNDKSSIRQAFRVASQSAVRASQGAAGFSKTASQGFGGFGN